MTAIYIIIIVRAACGAPFINKRVSDVRGLMGQLPDMKSQIETPRSSRRPVGARMRVYALPPLIYVCEGAQEKEEA